MKYLGKFAFTVFLTITVMSLSVSLGWGLSAPNIPLDSPVYEYINKLAGFGLITSDVKGIRPFSRAEAARLLLEAERNFDASIGSDGWEFARDIISELRYRLPREISLYRQEEAASPVDVNPLSSYRLRHVYVDGRSRDFDRPVHDPGNDGVFGIGSGLRPRNPYPFLVRQRGGEGTPLLENNEGIHYRDGSNVEFRFTSEAYGGSWVSMLVEPMFLYSAETESLSARLNKGYIKIGGGGLELEAGRDANWLGLGYRGAITLTNNAKNFDLVKLSSPEPINISILGGIKYVFILSRFDETVVDGTARHPWFFAAKFSVKPIDTVEVGINLGRQVGGPGVDNSVGSVLRGFVGGTDNDNSNSIAGLEVRARLPFLRNTEVYGEFSGEDSASFWPIVESYVAGVYVPRLTASGHDDFRFEFFKGNRILYTNGTFPAGYVYQGMPIGHSQGGAVIEFYARYSHWFSPRNNLALEFIRTDRGHEGRVEVNGVMQAIERKHAGRITWTLPVHGDLDLNVQYGAEKITNVDLVAGSQRTNHLAKMEFRFRF